MSVAADDVDALACRERDQVVVGRIFRPNLWRIRRILDDFGVVPQEVEKIAGRCLVDASAQLGPAQNSLELVEEPRAQDELDRAVAPSFDQTRRSSATRKSRRDQNVCVEDEPHALGAPLLSRPMLLLDR